MHNCNMNMVWRQIFEFVTSVCIKESKKSCFDENWSLVVVNTVDLGFCCLIFSVPISLTSDAVCETYTHVELNNVHGSKQKVCIASSNCYCLSNYEKKFLQTSLTASAWCGFHNATIWVGSGQIHGVTRIMFLCRFFHKWLCEWRNNSFCDIRRSSKLCFAHFAMF